MAAQPFKNAIPPPKFLSGGDPQIAKGFGDESVQAYIAAMPGWKSAVGKRLDLLIVQTVPEVCKAVKWNSPLYGMDDKPWFLSIHCYAKYINLAFFNGQSLQPVPPVESKMSGTRYLHIFEDGPLHETPFIERVDQASQLPGQKM